MGPRVRGLDRAGPAVQTGDAPVGLGLLAKTLSLVGIRRRVGFQPGLFLVLQCPGLPLARSLLTFERSLVDGAIFDPRTLPMRLT